jgi:hypothetical protein
VSSLNSTRLVIAYIAGFSAFFGILFTYGLLLFVILLSLPPYQSQIAGYENLISLILGIAPFIFSYLIAKRVFKLVLR